MTLVVLLFITFVRIAVSSSLNESLMEVAACIATGDIQKARGRVDKIIKNVPPRSEEEINEIFNFIYGPMSSGIQALCRRNSAMELKHRQSIQQIWSDLLADVCRHDWCQSDIEIRKMHLNAFQNVLEMIQRTAVDTEHTNKWGWSIRTIDTELKGEVESEVAELARRNIEWVTQQKAVLISQDAVEEKIEHVERTLRSHSPQWAPN